MKTLTVILAILFIVMIGCTDKDDCQKEANEIDFIENTDNPDQGK